MPKPASYQGVNGYDKDSAYVVSVNNGAYIRINDDGNSFVIGTICSDSCKEIQESFNFPVSIIEMENWINSMQVMQDAISLVSPEN